MLFLAFCIGLTAARSSNLKGHRLNHRQLSAQVDPISVINLSNNVVGHATNAYTARHKIMQSRDNRKDALQDLQRKNQLTKNKWEEKRKDIQKPVDNKIKALRAQHQKQMDQGMSRAKRVAAVNKPGGLNNNAVKAAHKQVKPDMKKHLNERRQNNYQAKRDEKLINKKHLQTVQNERGFFGKVVYNAQGVNRIKKALNKVGCKFNCAVKSVDAAKSGAAKSGGAKKAAGKKL